MHRHGGGGARMDRHNVGRIRINSHGGVKLEWIIMLGRS
jgi:hypothetical protein